jgi:uncharacterized protein YjeT (DUF2065 family)
VIEDVVRAVGLMLVFEGILPFLMPRRWQGILLTVTSSNQRSIRFIGLMSMLFGLSMLVIMR